ncbi:MAG: hypothetical protein U5N53_26930 [Mycobacterium sp.]|nr:hypothetical protein [Mycobacterium sp.]
MVEAVACGTRSVIDSFERSRASCERLVFSGGIETKRPVAAGHRSMYSAGRPSSSWGEPDPSGLRGHCRHRGRRRRFATDGAQLFAPDVRVIEPDPDRIALWPGASFEGYQRLTAILAPFVHDSADRLSALATAVPN